MGLPVIFILWSQRFAHQRTNPRMLRDMVKGAPQNQIFKEENDGKHEQNSKSRTESMGFKRPLTNGGHERG